MKLLLKLLFREAWYHRARLSLTVLATIAMSCMIVWLVGSLDLMVLKFDEDAENYFGHYHLAMVPGKESDSKPSTPAPLRDSGSQLGFPESVIKELRSDELVAQLTPARQIRGIMGKMKHDTDDDAAVRRQRSVTGIPWQSPAVIGIETSESPFEIKEGRWFDEDADMTEGVMGTSATKSLQGWENEESTPVKVGDTVIFRVETNDFKIKVVGLIEQNLSAGGRDGADPAVGALYVPINAARRMSPNHVKNVSLIDYIYVRLREGANTKRFEENWSKHLASQNIDMKFIDPEKVQQRLNNIRARSSDGLMGGAASLYSILLFSTFVSVLIVFTALSMGVNERTRIFAMLRAVGLSRYKVALLVLGESVILCFFGWIGGMLAGWLVLQISVWMQPDVFGTGKIVSLGMSSIMTAGFAVLIGSLLAAVFPAWRATRISPLEGMNRGYPQTVNKKLFVLLGLLGTILLAVNPILVYSEHIAGGGDARLFLYTYLGLPTQIIGCLLLAPAMILLIEKLFTGLIAWLLRLPKELLVSQLSSNLWRTLGTTLALSVGLGVYSFLEISGYSMLVPYIQSKTLPNTLVTFLPTGLPISEIDSVRNMPGVDSKRFLPIALDQSHFSQRQADRFMANGLIRMQTSAVVFGVDIEAAFDRSGDGSHPLIELPFQEGTLEAALQKLKSGGRYCLVPDSFAHRAGVHVGDKLELVLPDKEEGLPGVDKRGHAGRRSVGSETDRPDPIGEASRQTGRPGDSPPDGRNRSDEQIVEYEICGVVSIHGWLWMNKISGVRKRGYRSGAMLLAPYETVMKDYSLNDAAYFWFDRTLDAAGKPTVSDTELENSLQQLAERSIIGRSRLRSENSTTNGSESLQLPKTALLEGPSRPMVKLSSREYLLERVGSRADQVIQAAAKMPLILLAISSFGMMSTIAASVRVRRFEFGVLRSLGITRFGLIRLILAEALLISLAAIVISFGFGLIGGWCFIGLMKYVSGFGGFTNPLTIPFYWLSIGFITTLAFCTLSAIGPAVLAGRTEPPRLLQDRYR